MQFLCSGSRVLSCPQYIVIVSIVHELSGVHEPKTFLLALYVDSEWRYCRLALKQLLSRYAKRLTVFYSVKLLLSGQQCDGACADVMRRGPSDL